jgi:hydrogenase maturation protease
MKRILVYGFGNPGRQDDGLGPRLAEMIDGDGIPGLSVESNYQLNIEDAALVADADCVIFVDASLSGEGPFFFEEIGPADEITFTTHEISPQSVLALGDELFGSRVKAYILGIRGYQWDFAEGLSDQARDNLSLAHEFLREVVQGFLCQGEVRPPSAVH